MSIKLITPYFAEGRIIKGFSRGSKALGIPTANLDESAVKTFPASLDTGIYCGWSNVLGRTNKMVMSVGWNPFYNNKEKSMEVHILDTFENDFYGETLKIIVLAYIRPEKNFPSVDDLVTAIRDDIRVANDQLEEPELVKYKMNDFLRA